MKKLRIVSVLILLTFLSCDPSDDSGNNSSDHFTENFGATASRDFIGQVVDAANQPIQNATVKIGSSTVQTDVNGVFMINGATVYQKFAYITAKKAGFIDGSRAMVPTSGKNNVKIMLLDDAPLETVQSGMASEVSIYSGTKIVFDGAFQDESGHAYSGAVSVSMFHLTPSDENIGAIMPGMLYAQAKDGGAKVLETFGMLHAELTGSGGQKLQIASGHHAQITMRIDDSQLATAPATIPLWHFDEVNGYWKEEGSATKIGNKYVGNVSHFSWWNCDAFSSTVNLTVTVLGPNNFPIINAGVSLSVVSSGFSSYVNYTNANGQVSDLIPSNEVLTLSIVNECGNVIYTQQVGPFATDTVLPPIMISNNASMQTTHIIGSFTKCDDAPISNGYVLLYNDNKTIVSALDNGTFQFTTLVCGGSNTFELEGIDMDNIQTTGRIAYNFSFPTTLITNLRSCNTLEEFISFKVDNDPIDFIITDFNTASAIPNQPFRVQGNTVWGGTNPSVTVCTGSTAVGTYDISDPNTRIVLRHLFGGATDVINLGSFEINSVYGVTGTVIINKYGSVGDYIDARFSGTFHESNINVLNHIDGIIHVKRRP